ncbi:MAG: hypothetical protein M0030_22030 [Actinomycetota bacterium]|nr:hypothetical protein [Actinomycetota bacterium]
MSVAEDFRLTTRAAAAVLEQVLRSVSRWREVAALHGLRQAEIDAMEAAFEHAERDRALALTA